MVHASVGVIHFFTAVSGFSFRLVCGTEQEKKMKYIGLTSINFQIKDFQRTDGTLIYTLIRRSWLAVPNYTRQYIPIYTKIERKKTTIYFWAPTGFELEPQCFLKQTNIQPFFYQGASNCIYCNKIYLYLLVKKRNLF